MPRKNLWAIMTIKPTRMSCKRFLRIRFADCGYEKPVAWLLIRRLIGRDFLKDHENTNIIMNDGQRRPDISGDVHLYAKSPCFCYVYGGAWLEHAEIS